MPTKRRRVPRMAIESQDWRYYCARDLPRPPHVAPPRPWHSPDLDHDDWKLEREAVLREWVKAHPGTRPVHWWWYDARERRRRVGGTGSVYWAAMPETPTSYFRGMPNRWWTASHLEFLTRHTYMRQQPSADAVPYDVKDPPLFEAEGVYLERLGLLLPGEHVVNRQPEPCPLEPFLDFARSIRHSQVALRRTNTPPVIGS